MEEEDVYSEFYPLGKFPGVYRVKNVSGVELATKNADPGHTVYGERLFQTDFGELREFSHKRSKLASSILRNFRFGEFNSKFNVLYLGASFGTTPSHFSDLLVEGGKIFAVEFAPRPMRDLLQVADRRQNIIPILGDARYPDEYSHLVGQVDLVYCDVAQASQSELFVHNMQSYLKSGGHGLITIKAKSISQVKSPRDVFDEQERYFKEHGFEILDSIDISRYHREHRSIFVKY